MPLVRIDGTEIPDFDSFHAVFRKAFGFPGFYGCNMNAWIDCMSDLSEATGMTTVQGSASDPVVLKLDNCTRIPEGVFTALVECAGFVNWRRVEEGKPAVLLLAFDRSG